MKTEMANRIKIAAKVAMPVLKTQLHHRQTIPDENKKRPSIFSRGVLIFSLRMAFLKRCHPSKQAVLQKLGNEYASAFIRRNSFRAVRHILLAIYAARSPTRHE
jgi:hypothetical protein